MTLIYKFDLDILKMYWRTKMKFVGQGFLKLEHEQDSERHRQKALPSTFSGGKNDCVNL